MVATVARESFEQLLKNGPINGDLISGLDELRYKILIDGIPSNSDGMVCSECISLDEWGANEFVVRIAHVHLVDTAQFGSD